ncbi:MAG: hypothetical protein Q4G45_14045 [Actinomycetia bacterium]|nr:hypothetical protein [Actinomycetes bacterium]
MQRRAFLGMMVAALVGCSGTTLDDPRVKGTPQTYVSTPPVRPAGADHVLTLELEAAARLEAAAKASWAGADAARWQSLAATRRAHAAVLASLDPLRREPGQSPTLRPTTPAASKDAGQAAVTAALTSARDAALVLSGESSGVLSAFWASLAASAQQGLSPAPAATARKAVPMRLVETASSSQVAANQALGRLHEAVYGMQSVLGMLPARHQLRPAVATLVTTLKTERDSLVAYLRTRSVSPDPGPGVYSVPPVPPNGQALPVVGGLLEAVTQAAAVWVASAGSEDHHRSVDLLLAASGYGLPLGLGLAEYPGWPD